MNLRTFVLLRPSVSWAMTLVVVYAIAQVSCEDSTTAKTPTGCGAPGADGTIYDPQIDPANFGSIVDNAYFPLIPGTVFTYRSGDEKVEVTVTSQTKTILGVQCAVVHDVASLASTGEILEDTYDWYAQDKAGNVWYFGEDTKAFQRGTVVSTMGSWQAGVDCAKPGVIMLGQPKVGDSYRQEYLQGAAEDRADVVSLTEQTTVPYGSFSNCLKTKDYSDLEPGKSENKFFCPGIGEVLSVDVTTIGTGKREELISITRM